MAPPELVDLARGHPDPTLLPAERLRAVAGSPVSVGSLSYGREAGRRSFVASLARFLEGATGEAVDPETLFVTAGASHGLDLVASRLARPGDTVVVEAPTYFHAIGLLRGRGLSVEAVEVDEQGLRVDALEARIAQGLRPTLVYTIPVFQNPAGVTMSPSRRRALVALAEAHDFSIVADEVYQLLSYGAPPPPPLRHFGPERVISLGSFSKILAPGLRLGWVQAEPEPLAALAADGMMMSGGGVNPWVQAVIRPLLDDGGLLQIIDGLRATYRTRAEALASALRAALGPQVDLRTPEGGYFCWAELPDGVEAQVLLPIAARHGVRFLPGPRCSATGEQARFVRAGFSLYPSEILELGAKRLGAALQEALQSP